MKGVHLQLSEELLARIDAERGMVARNRWIRWAVEQALGGQRKRGDAREAESPPAPAERLTDGDRPSWSGPKDVYRGSEVEAEWRARSSVQAKRGTGPRPKAKP